MDICTCVILLNKTIDYSMLPFPTTLPDSDSEETTFSHAPTTEILDNDQVSSLFLIFLFIDCTNKKLELLLLTLGAYEGYSTWFVGLFICPSVCTLI